MCVCVCTRGCGWVRRSQIGQEQKRGISKKGSPGAGAASDQYPGRERRPPTGLLGPRDDVACCGGYCGG